LESSPHLRSCALAPAAAGQALAQRAIEQNFGLILVQGWSLLATSGFEDVDLQLNQYNAQQPVMLLAQSAAAPSSSAAPSASAAAASAASVSWNPFLNLPPEACAPQMQVR
jgi:hypothetical protein